MMNSISVLRSALGLALVAGLTTAALAQSAPHDLGLGVKRGISELAQSGQIGSVTLLHAPAGTHVSVLVHDVPANRVEPVMIVRAKSCEEPSPKAAWTLEPLKNGRSMSVVAAPASQLLSGNYAVVVHAADSVPGHYLACGELYR